MKFRKIIAGIMAAVLVAAGTAVPVSDMQTLSVVSEAASGLKAPKFTSGSTTTDSITLKWNAVSGAAGYKLYKYSPSKGKFTSYKTVKGTSVKLSGMVSGVTYRFKVAAYVKKNGKKVTQTLSSEIKVVTKKLSAPTDVRASDVSKTNIKLTWNGVKGADSYRIYMADDDFDGNYKIKDTASTYFLFTNLKAGYTYTFRVAALVRNGSRYVEQTLSNEKKCLLPKEETLNIPDFTVYDGQGGRHKLSDYLGKPIIINLWATWCGPCQRELPYFEKFYREYGGRVQFMMIDVWEDRGDQSNVKEFLRENEYTFPVFYDFDYSVDSSYGQGAIPVTYVINKNGELVDSHVGSMSESELKAMLNEIL